MKIKRWKKFNESNSGEELDFETFKDIMTEISDIFDCTFESFNSEGEVFYDAKIEIPEISEVDLSSEFFSWKFLNEYIPPYDEPSTYGEIFEGGMIYNALDEWRNKFEQLNSEMQRMTSSQERVKKVFQILEQDIIPRFRFFSNFQECSIGFDYNEYDKPELRVTFDIDIED
jgi:hypothetical protein